METEKPGRSKIQQVKVLFAFIGLLMFLVAVSFLADRLQQDESMWANWSSSLLLATMKTCTLVCFLFVGSSIGSFVNVVAYRMPLGKSIITNPSACPRCRKHIHGRDNLPVLGWMMLGGKCRSCALPISSRYPLVELWFGLLAILLFLFEAILGASNIPGRERPFRTGVVEMIWGLKWDVLFVYLYHFVLVSALATLTLFKLDRNRIPFLAGSFFILTLAIPPMYANYLHPVSGHSFQLNQPLAVAFSMVIGGLAGAGIGLLVEKLTSFAGFNGFLSKGFVLAMGITGVALGWQATVSSAIIFSLIFFLSRLFTGRVFLASGPLLGMFNVAVLIQICLWKSLTQFPFWPGKSGNMIEVGLGLIAIVGVLLASQYLVARSDEPEYVPHGYGEELPKSFESEFDLVEDVSTALVDVVSEDED